MRLNKFIYAFVFVVAAAAIVAVPALANPQQEKPHQADRFTRPPGYTNRAALSETLARHRALARLGVQQDLSPVARIERQENARGNDPSYLGPSAPPRPVVEIVESGGFDWGDAGVGVGAACGAFIAALGVAVLIRSRSISHVREEGQL